jgi:hypothetical protein
LKALTVSAVTGLAIAVYLLPEPRVKRSPGILAPDEPRQGRQGDRAWDRKGYRLHALATFHVRGRILLRDRYWLGRESDLSPLDLTLGWGRLSDTSVLDGIDMYRGHRCFYWKPKTAGPPVPPREIVTHTANIHLIPADEKLADALTKLRIGDVVELGGLLVEVTAGGWKWTSSLTREDSGPGACEVMWVEWMRPG